MLRRLFPAATTAPLDPPVAHTRPVGQFVGPITTAGAACIVLGVAAYLVGWRLGWIELLVVAAACLFALLAAVPFVLGRTHLSIERSLVRDRVSVGEPARVDLIVTNNGRVPSRRVDLDEKIGASVLPLAIPVLTHGASHTLDYELDTRRRARLLVGPSMISRSDPLGLLRRHVTQSAADVCWVYPRTRHVAPLPVGFAKDLEGPTSDTSPAGDVAFHAVRPYVLGDDRRHIHWLSTAKTGSLMVRHYVDNRRPQVAVLLDVGAAGYGPDSFETAVAIVASLASSLLRHRLPLSVRFGGETVLGVHTPGDLESVMERLTLASTAHQSSEDLLVSTAEFLRQERMTSALVIVTGARPAGELLPSVQYARRSARTIVVPCGAPRTADASVDDVADRDDGTMPGAPMPVAALPGARTIPVHSLDEFVAGWSGVAR